jgi:hypothetical protein
MGPWGQMVVTLPSEYLQMLPPGLNRPFLRGGIALIVLGILLLIYGAAAQSPWAILGGLTLPLIGFVLTLICRFSDGSYFL